MKILWSSMLIVALFGQGHAKSFGIVGEVFPIVEKSFLALIEERLKTLESHGELEALNQQWLKTVVNHTNRPSPLGLKRTTKSSHHDYLPEIRLSQSITDSAGRILYPKGTYVNALEKLTGYRPCWLFFNADDKAQLNWAKLQQTRCPNPKFILTSGAINVTENALQAVIYFDQQARITTKLNISHVPAKVTRLQNKLLIEELAIKENGDEL